MVNPRRSNFAVEAIGEFGGREYFCISEKLLDGSPTNAPFVLAIDAETETQLRRLAAVHFARMRTEGITEPQLMAAVMGPGHPAMLSEVMEGGKLTFLREIDTTLMYVEMPGKTGFRSIESAPHESALVVEPPAVAPAPSVRWWQFWRR